MKKLNPITESLLYLKATRQNQCERCGKYDNSVFAFGYCKDCYDKIFTKAYLALLNDAHFTEAKNK